MARQFFLYGSSPSELAGQQQNYDRYYTGADESNRAAFQAADARALEAAMRARSEDDAARRADQTVNLNLWRYRMQDQERADETSRRAAERFQTLVEGKRQFDISSRLQGRQVGVQEKAQTWREQNESPLDVRKQEFAYKSAFPKAQSGLYNSVAHVKMENPDLTDANALAIYDISQAVQRQENPVYNRALAGAKTVDRAQMLRNYIRLSEEAKPKLFPWYSFSRSGAQGVDYENKRIADWRNELGTVADPASVASIAARFQADPSITFDPATGGHVPVNIPSWVGSGATQTATTNAVAPRYNTVPTRPASSLDIQQSLANAATAIRRNPAAKSAILQRLRENGIDPSPLE